MVFWYEIDLSTIECTPASKDKLKYTIQTKPLRFQIPRGKCTWGVSSYKSFQVDLSNDEFINWWKNIESLLCPREPFTSNMKLTSLRIKIDESTHIFDGNSNQVSPEIKEGLFRDQEVSCIIDIDSNYFFNNSWGLTVRAHQVRFYEKEGIEKGVCAFLED